VAVEITPLIPAQAPQELQGLSPQPRITQGGMGGGIEGDRGGWGGHEEWPEAIRRKRNKAGTDVLVAI
jgi:hypothetical protein